METRIETLESTVAMQERAIDELNQALIAQQTQLLEMERKVNMMANKLRTMNHTMDQKGSSEDAPPPHYSE